MIGHAWWRQGLPRSGLPLRARTSRPTGPGSMTTTWPRAAVWPAASAPRPARVCATLGLLDGDGYEQWVAGRDPVSGQAAGSAPRGRATRCGSSRSRSTARRPGRWPRHCIPEVAAAYDAAQDRAAEQIIGWVAEHATTRVGPAGPAGAGAGREARGGHGPALHLPRRGSAPSSPPPGQRAGVRRRASGVGCTRSGSATPSRRSTASATPR